MAKQYVSISLGYDGDKIDTSYSVMATTGFLAAVQARLTPQTSEQGKKWQIYEFTNGALRLVCDQDGLRV